MTYNELVAAIQDTTEQTFTTVQLDLFITQAERKVYAVIDSPMMRQQETKTLSSGADYFVLPTDYLYIYNVSISDPASNTINLIRKDESFLREAYPFTGGDSEVSALAKYYAISDSGTIASVAPVFNSTSVQVTTYYAGQPLSITDPQFNDATSETQLSGKFPNVLLNGCLVEAARFMKAEQDIIANYDNMFQQSLTEYKIQQEGKNKQDAYRNGQTRVPVQ